MFEDVPAEPAGAVFLAVHADDDFVHFINTRWSSSERTLRAYRDHHVRENILKIGGLDTPCEEHARLLDRQAMSTITIVVLLLPANG